MSKWIVGAPRSEGWAFVFDADSAADAARQAFAHVTDQADFVRFGITSLPVWPAVDDAPTGIRVTTPDEDGYSVDDDEWKPKQGRNYFVQPVREPTLVPTPGHAA